jgi:DNA/RNA-binding domain of Phe-tRNA-synthetase-like protein
MTPMLIVEPHPLLHLVAFEARLSSALGEQPSPAWLVELLRDEPLSVEGELPVRRTEELRGAVRDLLRHGGYKPTGRGKPASEYLIKAAAEGIGSINLAVDACNAVSLHSGLPISVVDLDRAFSPLRVGIVTGDQRYVFNSAGQEIRLEGLLCLHDRQGPCANGVKDSQRTKTSEGSRRTLSLIWGPRGHADHTEATGRWYRALLERAGAETIELPTEPPR